MMRRQDCNRSQRGTSLLEVLITMVIIAIGLLGFAGLQTFSLKSNRVSMQRSLATLYAYSALDSIRVNRINVADYAQGFDNTPDCDSDPLGATGVIASDDLALWNQSVACNLPSGQGAIVLNGSTVTISIRWKDGTSEANPFITWSTSSRL